jgi:hypothetical protein
MRTQPSTRKAFGNHLRAAWRVLLTAIWGAAIGTTAGSLFGLWCGLLYGVLHWQFDRILPGLERGLWAGLIAGAAVGGFGRLCLGHDVLESRDWASDYSPSTKKHLSNGTTRGTVYERST